GGDLRSVATIAGVGSHSGRLAGGVVDLVDLPADGANARTPGRASLRGPTLHRPCVHFVFALGPWAGGDPASLPDRRHARSDSFRPRTPRGMAGGRLLRAGTGPLGESGIRMARERASDSGADLVLAAGPEHTESSQPRGGGDCFCARGGAPDRLQRSQWAGRRWQPGLVYR